VLRRTQGLSAGIFSAPVARTVTRQARVIVRAHGRANQRRGFPVGIRIRKTMASAPKTRVLAEKTIAWKTSRSIDRGGYAPSGRVATGRPFSPGVM
jgi:hypothetical protein